MIAITPLVLARDCLEPIQTIYLHQNHHSKYDHGPVQLIYLVFNPYLECCSKHNLSQHGDLQFLEAMIQSKDHYD